MKPKPRHNQEAVSIGDLVNQVFQKYGLSRGAEYRLVFESWDRIAPPEYLGRAKAVSFRNGKLIVAVESSPLLEELRGYRAGEFVALLNQDLSVRGEVTHLVVRGIEFRRN
ncbi:MAG: DciA family protein [Planctomycetota bacterium]